MNRYKTFSFEHQILMIPSCSETCQCYDTDVVNYLKDGFELIKLFMKEDHIETSKFNIYYRETMNISKIIN